MNYDLLSSLIHPYGVLDLGCNVGDWHNQARLRWPHAHFMLVDGNPACIERIQQTGASHRIALLGDEEKEVTFYTEKNNPVGTGASYFLENTQFYTPDKREEHKMTTQRLDDLFPDDVYDLWKVDLQGAELAAFKGGINLLSRAKWVLCECSHVEYNQGAPMQSEVNDFLRTQGFHPQEILGNINHPITGQHIQSDILFTKRP